VSYSRRTDEDEGYVLKKLGFEDCLPSSKPRRVLNLGSDNSQHVTNLDVA
jgi:hypothetical protein